MDNLHDSSSKAREKSDLRLRTARVLSERDIWSDANVDVWRADSFSGCPSFYPVYQYQNCYSHSVINLIQFKGHLALNQQFIARARRNRMEYYSGVDTVDRDIARIGGVITSTTTVRSQTAYAARIAEAMKADVLAVESKYPDHQHAVMCGGKDSLTILLLPWRTRLIALSAAPNLPLVKEFVSRNGLPHNVVELKDQDTSSLRDEVLYNACFNNLEHCRWTGELKALASGCAQKIIVWKGQLASVFTTPSWRTYAHGTNRAERFYRKRIESRLRHASTGYLENRFFRAVWHRGAMWQGAHMSLLRSVCGALFLSAYHGEAMTKLFSEVDLRTAVISDVRPMVGRMLWGSEVTYPATNPGPPRSRIRSGISDPEHFLTAFRDTVGLPIYSE